MWYMKHMELEFIREYEKMEVDRVAKDYIKIAYAAGGNLFISRNTA